jgi:hypothetical protein
MKGFCPGRLAAACAFCFALTALPARADSYSFRVKHIHAFGGCEGTLRIAEDDIRYDTAQRDDARIWLYPQIKNVERKGFRRLVLHTYEDQTLQFGRDKAFAFDFLDGEISTEVYNFVVTRVGQPADRQPAALPPGGRFEFAVKHLHLFGGCEGTLRISDIHIEYVTEHVKDSRLWKYLDIKALSQPSPYRLGLATYEDQTLQFGRDKTFAFQLKEPLEPSVLEFIRRRMPR